MTFDWQQLILSFNEFLRVILIALGFFYLFFGLDDLLLDLIAWVKRLRPRRMTIARWQKLLAASEKQIAVLVPAWHESAIIRRMLVGNLQSLRYQNVHFFVGVYPNDPDTIREVRKASEYFPNIHAVINPLPGPSSKGQNLNAVLKHILAFENTLGSTFDAFLLQDSEDLIHPESLKLINFCLDKYEYIQVPIFSLDLRLSQLVSGTYVDEFAEAHTRDILVREALGAAVPSAGVGTAFSRKLVSRLIAEDGSVQVFNEKALTEDYDLGVRTHLMGFQPHFACYFIDREDGSRDYIATREYFPKAFRRSIRQKARWTTGIALQGWKNVGWKGNLINRYFLYRDRKGLLTNPIGFLGYLCVAILLLTSAIMHRSVVSADTSPSILLILKANLVLMGIRLVQRALAVYRVYGMKPVFLIPIRWPIAITINAFATYFAVKNTFFAWARKTSLTWSKTEHELPPQFGEVGRQVEIVP